MLITVIDILLYDSAISWLVSHQPVFFECLSWCYAPLGPIHTMTSMAILSGHCVRLEFFMPSFVFLAGSAIFILLIPQNIFFTISNQSKASISVNSNIHLHWLATWVMVWWSRICYLKAKFYCPQGKGWINSIDKHIPVIIDYVFCMVALFFSWLKLR